MLTGDIILSHLQTSEKRFRHKENVVSQPAANLYTNSQLPTHWFFEPGVFVQGLMDFEPVCPSSVSKGASYHDSLVTIFPTL